MTFHTWERGTYCDGLPTGEVVVLFEGKHLEIENRVLIPLPPGESFGIMFLGMAETGEKFCGLSHDIDQTTGWEYERGKGWRKFRTQTGRMVYSPDGQILDTFPAGYQYFDKAANEPISRIITHEEWNGLNDWSSIGPASAPLFIGQGHNEGEGLLVWDGLHHRQIDDGNITEHHSHWDPQSGKVAVSYIKHGVGSRICQTTMYELRTMPVFPPVPVPPDPTPIPPDPIPVPIPPQPIPPVPVPIPLPRVIKGDVFMLSKMMDPTKQVIPVKSVKVVAGSNPPVYTLILPSGRVFSCQGDGSAGDRDPGTDGQWERCRVSGNIATFHPSEGDYFTWAFAEVSGL